MKKRRHHYVWRRYLQAWASNDLIWCCHDGKVFNSNLMGVGQSRDFYKLKELTPHDIDFIRKFINLSPDETHRNFNEGWIEFFNQVFLFKNFFLKEGINNSKIDIYINELINDFEENYHAKIESQTIQYIDSILNEDISFYETEEGCITFISFLCVQYFRTKKIQNSVYDNFKKHNALNTVNIENTWGILRHIFASGIAGYLFVERANYRMILIRNHSDIPLITGDQPVINTFAVGKLGSEVVNEFEFYYPLSPKLAILISKQDRYKSLSEFNISDTETHVFNRAIIDCSHEQIYANSKEILEDYCLVKDGVIFLNAKRA